jgi:hypothetical protein
VFYYLFEMNNFGTQRTGSLRAAEGICYDYSFSSIANGMLFV